jgi:hypothetical protein
MAVVDVAKEIEDTDVYPAFVIFYKDDTTIHSLEDYYTDFSYATAQ